MLRWYISVGESWHGLLRSMIIWLNGCDIATWYVPLRSINVCWSRSNLKNIKKQSEIINFVMSFYELDIVVVEIVSYLTWILAGGWALLDMFVPDCNVCCCCACWRLEAFLRCNRPWSSKIRWSTDRNSACLCCKASLCKCRRASCWMLSWLRYCRRILKLVSRVFEVNAFLCETRFSRSLLYTTTSFTSSQCW